jgi:hypothetical protein
MKPVGRKILTPRTSGILTDIRQSIPYFLLVKGRFNHEDKVIYYPECG